MLMEGQSGPQAVGDGAINALRVLKDSSIGIQMLMLNIKKLYTVGCICSTCLWSIDYYSGLSFRSWRNSNCCLWNPPGSGKILSVLQVAVSVGANGNPSVGTIGLSGGNTANITAVGSVPLNLLSLQTGGSVAKHFVNTATTGSTALTAIRPLWELGLLQLLPKQHTTKQQKTQRGSIFYNSRMDGCCWSLGCCWWNNCY